MNMRQAMWVNGQVVLEGQPDWPEGRRLLVLEVEPSNDVPDKIGLNESEWRDDPETLAEWKAWLATIEPVPFNEPSDFDEAFRRFNIEAVRQQMLGEKP